MERVDVVSPSTIENQTRHPSRQGASRRMVEGMLSGRRLTTRKRITRIGEYEASL